MAPRRGQVYLVTGGCSFLGYHLVKMLVERSDGGVAEVRVFDLYLDDSMRHLGTEDVKVTLVQGDITALRDVTAVVEGADVVIHTGAIVNVWGKVPASKITDVIIHGTENVIQACITHGVEYLIYTSSMEVVGPNMHGDPFYRRYSGKLVDPPFNRGDEETVYNTYHDKPYPKSKAEAEALVIAANGTQVKGGKELHTCALRPTGIYGEQHDVMRLFYEQGVRLGRRLPRIIPSSTEHERVYVGNVAWMHLLAAQKIQESPALVGGQCYFCYDHSPYLSYDKFNMQFLSHCGFKFVGSRPLIPYFLLFFIAFLNEMLQWLLRPFYCYTPLLNKYTLAVASTTFTVKTNKAERHLGYRPLYSWKESKARTIRWVKSFDTETAAERSRNMDQ